MAAIRGRDTSPELALRSALFRRGYRYRIDARDLPGKPDMKLTKFRAVIFAHGCFWHGHDCPKFRPPKTNRAFWRAKIRRNRERDRRVVAELLESGWRVAVVWECALNESERRGDVDLLYDSLCRWLEGKRRFAEYRGRAEIQFPHGKRMPYQINASSAVFASDLGHLGKKNYV
jgi:DNA mismatch endonuclease, patch repair protein